MAVSPRFSLICRRSCWARSSLNLNDGRDRLKRAGLKNRQVSSTFLKKEKQTTALIGAIGWGRSFGSSGWDSLSSPEDGWHPQGCPEHPPAPAPCPTSPSLPLPPHLQSSSAQPDPCRELSTSLAGFCGWRSPPGAYKPTPLGNFQPPRASFSLNPRPPELWWDSHPVLSST